MANWWWLTPQGVATLLDAGRPFNQEKGVAEALAAIQPADKTAVMVECRRRGIKSDGKVKTKASGDRDPLYENVSFHLWRWSSKRGLAMQKKRGGEYDRKARFDSAATAPTVALRLMRAAVEPIAKDRLLTIAADPGAEAELDRLLAAGDLVRFASGKIMATRDE